MLKFTEMDSKVTLIQQMETDVSPVLLINRFTVTPEDVDQLLKAWAADAAFLKTQPGCTSAQLHRGIGGSCCFINVACLFLLMSQSISEWMFRPILVML